MKDLTQSRIASGLTAVAGIWLLLTPLVISMTGTALTSIFITGGVILLAGLIQMIWMNVIPSWVNLLAAVWLFISAFALTMSNGAAWNQVIVAVVTFVLAAWDEVEVRDIYHRMHPNV